jgi:hypothetical protein
MALAQIKNSFNSIGEVDASISASSLVLKFCVTMNAIRYFVLSQTHEQIIFFGDYTLHHINSEKEQASALEKIIEKDEILKLPFAKVLIGFDSTYSLLPSSFSAITKTEDQLSNNWKDVDLVFEASSDVKRVLQSHFSRTEFFHLNYTALSQLSAYTEGSSRKIFVNVGKDYLDVVSFDSANKLRLLNRYEYQTASDFIYFLLLCCEKLDVDRDNDELVLFGEVSVQSKIYDICYRYFRSISFLQSSENVHFTKAFETFPQHLHFNLYNLHS